MTGTNSKKNSYSFRLDHERTVEISSDFDGGNISLVKQLNQLYYILESVSDGDTVSKKTWFYFRVRAAKGIKLRMILENVNIFDSLLEDHIPYRVMCRQTPDGLWREHPDSFLTYRNETILVIDYTFRQTEDVYFCLTVPFTFTEQQHYLAQLCKTVPKGIHIEKEVLATSPEGRPIHLLTIANKSSSIQKNPVVLVTARVHPGEVSSSFCIQGILEFLLQENCLQAYLLRKLFTFLIVPMVNPDGVFQGNYRMDTNGINLNRVYADPSSQSHSAIYQIIEKVKKTMERTNIEFYLDLHSHSCLKDGFIYGNAFQDIVSQTHTELFCKILEMNSTNFKYSLCNFDEKHMRFKDRGESLSKEGCGRVVISKLGNVTRSYTLQSSVFTFKKQEESLKLPINNEEFVVNFDGQQLKYQGEIKPTGQEFIDKNKQLGRDVMVSILDIVHKNPYTRIDSNTLENYSREIASRLLQAVDRFKLLDIKAYSKAKLVNKLIKDQFYDKIGWNHLLSDEFLKVTVWPKNFKCLKCPELEKKTKSEDKELKEVRSSLKQPKILLKPCGETAPLQKLMRSSSSKDDYCQTKEFPQIKYSIELKGVQPLKPVISELILDKICQTKKRNLLSGFTNGKLNFDKTSLRRNAPSYNRLLVNKILGGRQKCKAAQPNDYQFLVVEPKRRIMTQIGPDQDEDVSSQRAFLKIASENDEEKRAKAEINRKGVNFRVTEALKKNERQGVRLPDLRTLLVDSTRRGRLRTLEASDQA